MWEIPLLSFCRTRPFMAFCPPTLTAYTEQGMKVEITSNTCHIWNKDEMDHKREDLHMIRKQNILMFSTLMIISCVICRQPAFAQEYSPAPEAIQAALFIKLFGFHKDLSKKEKIDIYVVASSGFAEEMEKAVGKKIGAATLSGVEEGLDLPERVPSVIYMDKRVKINEFIRYARVHRVLTITGNPELVAEGIALGIGILGGKPKVLLNVNASKEVGADWNPAMLRVSTLIKE